MRAEIISEHKADILKEGFYNAGYSIIGYNTYPRSDDVIVAWNRKKSNESKIEFYEKAGAKVLIAENGYIGKDDRGNRLIALAQNNHLGLGKWYIGTQPRYLSQNIQIMPWRQSGRNILLLAQRGIGNSKKLDWYNRLADNIRYQTNRKVKIRKHPGKEISPLYPELDNAHCVVTWSSSAAILALAYGIPCFHLLKGWIGQDASIFGIENLEKPVRSDRILTFHKIGWAQWSNSEIRSGEAIKYVMNP